MEDRLKLLCWIVAAALLLQPTIASAGWGARNKAPKKVQKRRSNKRSRKRPTAAKLAKAAAKLPLKERVALLLAVGTNLAATAAMPALRESVAAREMKLAIALAEAIADARRVKPRQLMEAARALGRTQEFPVQRRLWARAYAARATRYLQIRIAEGYVDALLAAKQHAKAYKVLIKAFRGAPMGDRRGLLERLIAWGKVTGEVDRVRDVLQATSGPDAAVLSARLIGELQGDDAALRKLRAAWKRYPGHRWLQRAYLKRLARLGYREELSKAVSKVVRLAPGDPMPFVQVLDAHIAARDIRGARKLIDKLLAKYPRHDVLIESLIDREQRLGEDRPRLMKLYESLLRAAPKQTSYAEAYAEWLLAQGGKRHAKAIKVLNQLAAMAKDRIKGQQRAATILQTHGYTAEAQKILVALRLKAPNNPAIERQMALLYGQIGRDQEAVVLWQKLSQLDESPTVQQRQGAGEARRSLVVLYRQRGIVVPLTQLANKLATGGATLGETLLYMDLYRAALANDVLPKNVAAPASMATGKYEADPEVLSRVAANQLRAGQRMAALATLKQLNAADPGGAEPLLIDLVQRALIAADSEAAQGAERVLRSARHVPTSLLLRLGNLRLQHGDRQAAAKLFRQAAVQNPRDTRAMYRLAQLFRHAGDAASESNALREIVLRTADGDELEKAGQRLLTLAMASGTCTDLLRWLDAITPQHSRRVILRRFRLLAYDAWLRTEPLERQISGARHQPQPALLSEALSSGDLAMKVRALRQIARTGRALPLALATRLLKDPNAVVRRDATLALAATGKMDAARLLVEMDVDLNGAVITAQLLAFGRLPRVDEALPLLESRITSKATNYSDLAALALGRVGTAQTIKRLLGRLRNSRSVRPAAAVAVGNLVGLHPDAEQAQASLAAVAALTFPDRHRDKLHSFFSAYAAMWSLAAMNRDDARAMLLARAVGAQSAILRRLALRLAAAPAPRLEPKLWDIQLRWTDRGSVSEKLLRRLLTPWLSPNEEVDRAALTKHAAALAKLLDIDSVIATRGSAAGRWCDGWRHSLDAVPSLKTWCAPALMTAIATTTR
jgi:predicted Zn-dependent protease